MYQQNILIGGANSTSILTTLYNSGPKPTAHITKGRGRLKTYGRNVYLKTGSNFEIELHNPQTTSVLAKIQINGQWISEAGLIVKPGQRVYLERFIDVAKKFAFETYEVEDSAEARAAIAYNGQVKVFFYDESTTPWRSGSGAVTWTNYPSTITYTSQPSSFNSVGANLMHCNNTAAISSSLETGRVEQGSKSSQEFSNGSGNFCDWANVTCEWQILPESKKPAEIGEIRSYCTGCGTRHKKSSWKFCPNCGTKIEN